MTENRKVNDVEQNGVTRFGIFTRNDGDSSLDLKTDADGMKNFPKAFIPMRELEESSPEA